MTSIPPPPVPTQLIVFADDWGRHPSSSQHLIRELLPLYPTLWVNTVGTRKPRLAWADLHRALDVFANWIFHPDGYASGGLPEGLELCAPTMYPGYRRAWQRRFNAQQVTAEVLHKAKPDHRRVVISTLPTTADLVGKLGEQKWIYYCVDDYSAWPGTDSCVMDDMERQLVPRSDAVVCVSEVLQDRVVDLCAESPELLPHGVAMEQWRRPQTDSRISNKWPGEARAVALFWGLIDERLDVDWCMALGRSKAVHAVYAGPFANDEKPLMDQDAICIGPIDHGDLAAHAAASNVLIMPYIDAPVTRAMQPLKLLEYLATMKPVVVRDLPSTRGWADCCDLASTAEEFVRLVRERVQTGTPAEQLKARERRLAGESWTAKAAQLAELINAGASS